MVREDLSEKVTLTGSEGDEKQSTLDTQFTPDRARVLLAYSRTAKQVCVAGAEGWKESDRK